MSTQKQGKVTFIYAVVLALIVWFAVILQFFISTAAYMQQGRTLGGSLVQVISFFTVLSNILAGFCLVAITLPAKSPLHAFFARRSVITAIAVYIAIVSLVYNTVLRGIVHLDGLFIIANELTHVFNPLAFVIFCLFVAPAQKLTIKQGLTWLWFPLLYLVYVIIRGAVYHLYPYPFLNVDKLGYQKVLTNSFFVMIAFLVFGALFFILNNRMAARSAKAK